MALRAQATDTIDTQPQGLSNYEYVEQVGGGELDRFIEEEGEEADAGAFASFLNSLAWDARHQLDRIKCEHELAQRYAAGLAVLESFSENLSRYEVHLDRKFQKTLSLLVQLQERRRRESVS